MNNGPFYSLTGVNSKININISIILGLKVISTSSYLQLLTNKRVDIWIGSPDTNADVEVAVLAHDVLAVAGAAAGQLLPAGHHPRPPAPAHTQLPELVSDEAQFPRSKCHGSSINVDHERVCNLRLCRPGDKILETISLAEGAIFFVIYLVIF